MRKIKRLFLVTILVVVSSCASVGDNFSFRGPRSIKIGKTSQRDVLRIYGRPYRVGYDNGLTMWTYAYYEYRVFGGSNTKDLVITFNRKNVVRGYVYNSSLEEDKIKILVNQKK